MPVSRSLLLLAWIIVPIALADDPPAPGLNPTVPAAPDPLTTDNPPPSNEPLRILVASTGRVFEGSVSETPGGYVVVTTAGRVTLPYDQVACTATSLRDAHQKLKTLCNPPTASGHVTLGRWCMENQLYDLAMEEVQSALQLEPSRAEARQLSFQLQAILNTGLPQEEPENLISWDHLFTPPVPAPGGLTRETTDEFVRRIQPLMLNTCANARCHGNSQASFCLDFVPASGVGSQSITTANLESIFAFVDINNPTESRLFTALQDPAIPQHRQALIGPQGREHLESIAEWIVQGSLERGGRPPGMMVSDLQLAAGAGSELGDVALAADGHAPLTLDNAPPISIEPLPAGSRLTPVDPPVLTETPRQN